MGTVSGDGNGWPPEELPDIPPEWGPVVVPDDPSALADEAAIVRRQLRRDRWRRRIGLRPRGLQAADGRPGRPTVPLVLLVVAITVTLASVVAGTWPGRSRPPVTPRGPAVVSTGPIGPNRAGRELPALELITPDGGTAPLRGTLPAVIVLVDRCACTALVDDIAATARAGIAVITVTAGRAAPGYSPPTGTPSPTPPAGRVQRLVDPTGELRTSLGLDAPDGTGAVALVDAGGRIDQLVPSTTTIEDFRADLARL